MDILSNPTATVEQAQQWAKNKGATTLFIALAPLYWEVATKVGVNPVVAYTQGCKETGFGKFGGVLNESYCNTGGMKNASGGGDYDPTAHKRFGFWKEGIEAQIDHLALYSGAIGYPKTNTLDPRHFAYLHGKCKTVESLGGSWAPSATYGTSIVNMVKEVENTKVEVVVNNEELDKVKSELEEKKLIIESLISENENLKNEIDKVLEFKNLVKEFFK